MYANTMLIAESAVSNLLMVCNSDLQFSQCYHYCLLVRIADSGGLVERYRLSLIIIVGIINLRWHKQGVSLRLHSECS